MKKLLVLAAAAALLAPALAFAQVDCSVTPEACQGGGNPTLISMPWGLTGGETPTVPAGTVEVDILGNKLPCLWYLYQGCYNITNTPYYLTQVLKLGPGWPGGLQ